MRDCFLARRLPILTSLFQCVADQFSLLPIVGLLFDIEGLCIKTTGVIDKVKVLNRI